MVADRCAELLGQQAFRQAAAAIATEIAAQPSLADVAADVAALAAPGRPLNAA
ncbi:hypothetical protein [Amycolatopsis sp. cmx-8-4]|uniref:hypothetical protein n=1 Tax=Amycolatopsis sp. cmx-8-4 TaxID=2790947 RepID=UPI00397C1F86